MTRECDECGAEMEFFPDDDNGMDEPYSAHYPAQWWCEKCEKGVPYEYDDADADRAELAGDRVMGRSGK